MDFLLQIIDGFLGAVALISGLLLDTLGLGLGLAVVIVGGILGGYWSLVRKTKARFFVLLMIVFLTLALCFFILVSYGLSTRSAI